MARVIDGDTIRARRAGVEEKVRLKGVDAPEIAHPDYGQFKDEPYGRESRECLARVLDGHTLRLDFQTGTQVPERDQYGRLLAYVWAGETLANAQIIKEGCARAFHKYPHPRRDEFVELEKEAQKARRGLWKDGRTSPRK